VGPHEWQKLLDNSTEYIAFLLAFLSTTINIATPAGKNELIQEVAKRIREWNHPVMVHESLRKLAALTNTPESVISLSGKNSPQIFVKRSLTISNKTTIDGDRILEADLLRWLIVAGHSVPELRIIAEKNLSSEHFRFPGSKILYTHILDSIKEGKACDILALAANLENPEEQAFLAEILQKRINREKAFDGFVETIQRFLERHWMQQREEIRLKIHDEKNTEAEIVELAKKFDHLRGQKPQVIIPKMI